MDSLSSPKASLPLAAGRPGHKLSLKSDATQREMEEVYLSKTMEVM